MMEQTRKCMGCKQDSDMCSGIRTEFSDSFGFKGEVGPVLLCPKCAKSYLTLVKKIDKAREDLLRKLALYLLSDTGDASVFESVFRIETHEDMSLEVEPLIGGTKH